MLNNHTPKLKAFNESHKVGSEVQIKQPDGTITTEVMRWHEAEVFENGTAGVWLKGYYDKVDFERVVFEPLKK